MFRTGPSLSIIVLPHSGHSFAEDFVDDFALDSGFCDFLGPLLLCSDLFFLLLACEPLALFGALTKCRRGSFNF